jgi:hypothetical protein
MSKMTLVLVLLFGAAAELGAAPQASKPSLDYQFFKTKVQPIFLKKREGRARCISCHVTPTGPIFRLQKLGPGESTWNEEQSRQNFQAVTQAIAFPGNAKSPLLIHPLAEEAGGDLFHSGGKQFPSQNDPEWQTLKEWIMGQTSSTSAQAGTR